VVLLIGVILLQEGKGGGLAEAFGGAGAETFGVKAAGINKFTSIVGGVFLAACIALTIFKAAPSQKPMLDRELPKPPAGAPNRIQPPPPPKSSPDKPASGGGAPSDAGKKDGGPPK
jgi:protein translocase SecG subunit